MPTSAMPQASAYNLSATTPDNNLASKTITPGAGTDRFGIAQQQFQNYAQQTAPQYDASIRSATAAGMGAGRMGSGMLRTSYGDLANQRNQQLQNAGNSFLTDALNGSIGDAYNNIGIAQQQQGFQAGQQQNAFNQALQTGQFNNATQAQQFGQGVTTSQLAAALQGQQFGQGVTQAQLEDQLLNSATNRSATQLGLGSTGNPTDTQLALSGIYGNQASQAGSALSGLIGNTVQNNANTQNTNLLNSILAQLRGSNSGNVGASVPTSTPTGTSTSGLFGPNSLNDYLRGGF